MKLSKDDIETAEYESLGYCQAIITATNKFSPIFIMPCTLDSICFSLSLCWPIESHKHAQIEICKAEGFDT